MGKDIADVNDEVLALAGPIHYISTDMTPILLQHGNADDICPMDQSQRFYNTATQTAGEGIAALDILDGATHGDSAFETDENVVPNPPEGLILAFCERFGVPFGWLKIVTDCIFVAMGVLISLLALGGIRDIREGIVTSAVLTGRIIDWLTKRWQLGLRRLAFPDQEEMEAALQK